MKMAQVPKHPSARMALTILSGAACALLIIANVALARDVERTWDSLVRVKSRNVDEAYLLPGANFSQYSKLMITPAEVAFQKNWLRDMNNQAMSLSRRVSDKDANRILEAARSGFDEIWVNAFKSAGFEVVTAPGPDVLKLTPAVLNLYINAPDIRSADRVQTYTIEAGHAVLDLEIRDSVSGALLGRAVDKRVAGPRVGQLRWTTGVSNRADFRRLFMQWAKIAADGLKELQQISPLPEAIEPNRKLPGD